MAKYRKSPKHGSRTRRTAGGVASKAPTNGNVAFSTAIQIKPTSSRRIGVDKANNEIVVFNEDEKGRFHGHVRDWDQLRPEMKKALVKASLTTKKGKII